MFVKTKFACLAAAFLALGASNIHAQNATYSKTPNNLEYQYFKGKPQTPKTKTLAGDIVEFDMIFAVGDSVYTNTKEKNNGNPIKLELVPFEATSAFNSGLPLEALYMMNSGDSAIFKTTASNFFKAMSMDVPAEIKPTEELFWTIKMHNVTSQKALQEEKKRMRKVNKSFAPVKGGLEYQFVTLNKAKDGRMAQTGDVAQLHVKYMIGDSVLFNSIDMDNGKPVPQQITAPQFDGDLMNGIMLMQAGDSASFRISAKDFETMTKMPLQEWMKPEDYHTWNIKVVKLQSPADVKKEQEEHAAAQGKVDADIIANYIKSQNYTTVQKTPSGLQYIVTKQGDGPKAKAGQKVTVNYTGMTTDGKKFDSNVDPQFNHVSPFQFNLGGGQVIKGWDEGIELLNVGSKAVLMIPSTLGYGARGAGADIPPNAVLVFEVELVAAD